MIEAHTLAFPCGDDLVSARYMAMIGNDHMYARYMAVIGNDHM